MKRISIITPYLRTGGPENLHQLASAINNEDSQYSASIAYIPVPPDKFVPLYPEYPNTVATVSDTLKSDFIVIPETSTHLIKAFAQKPNIKVIIAWLSVDNYFGGIQDRKTPMSLLKYYRRIVNGSVIRIKHLKRHLHLSQSHYAKSFLERHGINSTMVGDYINSNLFAVKTWKQFERKNRILYNPRKDDGFMSVLKKLIPYIECVPLRELNQEALIEFYRTSKLYIDFGYFPGNDRMWREAALNGCVVLTGTRGASGNPLDVPIPNYYKIDLRAENWEARAAKVCNSIMDNFGAHTHEFNNIRDELVLEELRFKSQVRSFLKSLNSL